MKKDIKSRKKKRDPMRTICWCVIPSVTALGIVADALGLYRFTKENLIVIGACFLIVLLPFFSEIKIKNVSVTRGGRERDE